MHIDARQLPRTDKQLQVASENATKRHGRPPKPDMTQSEYDATKDMTIREAADTISRSRYALTYPDRRVSHSWVGRQRRRWNGNPPGTKSQPSIGWNLRRILEQKAQARDYQDPEPHQVTAGHRPQNAQPTANAPDGCRNRDTDGSCLCGPVHAEAKETPKP